MKKLIISAAMFCLALASCQDSVEETSIARLTVVPEVLTLQVKSDEAVDEALVNQIKQSLTVYIFGEDFQAYYPYSEIPDYIEVPANSVTPYYVFAQNISSPQAEYLPDEWGQIRYAGYAEKMVNRITEPTEIKVNCTVANALVSVEFDQSIRTYYSDYKVTLTSPNGRILEFTQDNASTAIAYMTAGETIDCVFSGVFNIDDAQGDIPRTLALEPAMHYTIKVMMQNTEGSLSQPVINLSTECTDLYATITVDPSQDGVNDKDVENE